MEHKLLLINLEIQVNLIDKSERSESTDKSAKSKKRALEEKFTGVEFKTVSYWYNGCTNSPIEMVVTALMYKRLTKKKQQKF